MDTIIDTYIPIKQVVKELNVSRWFLLQEVKRGRLNAYKINGYRFRRSDVDTYIETNAVRPVSKE